MKKFLKIIFIFGALLTAPLVAETTFNEKQGQTLCLFAEDVFNALMNTKEKKQIESYAQSSDPIIQNLADKFIASFQKNASSAEIEAAISDLGRLLKCSADENYRLPYTLNRRDLQEKTAMMEKALNSSLPKDPNYHKLMIESLAEEKWPVALYAYFKIAESRCYD